MTTPPEGTPAADDRRPQVQAHALRLRRALNNELETLRRAAESKSADSMDGALYVLEGLVDDLVGLISVAPATDRVADPDNPPDPSPLPSGAPGSNGTSREPVSESWSEAWRSSDRGHRSPGNTDPARWLYYGILAVTGLVGLVGFFLLRDPLAAPTSQSIAPAPSEPVEASPAAIAAPQPSAPLLVPEAAAAPTPMPSRPQPVSTGLAAPFRDLPRHWAARSMAADGDYAGAATAWERILGAEDPEAFTLLVEIDCREATLEQQYGLFGDDPSAFFKPIQARGQDCFLLMYGLYATADEAREGVAALPPEFRERAEPPLVRRLRHVL